MKLVLPVNGPTMDTTICISFGRAPYFLVYDNEIKDGIFIENTAATSQGGAGIKAAQLIADSGAAVLLTPRCGENAAVVIKGAGIEIYKTFNDSIQDNISSFIDGKLALIDEIHAGFHDHGMK